MRTPRSTTLAVRLTGADKARLAALAKSTGRTRSQLAAEAISDYLAADEWQVAGIHQALASLAQGQVIDHADVREWVISWDGRGERPAPRPRAR